jgi:hypothetical protein
MVRMKTLSVIAIVTAATSWPVFARHTVAKHSRVHHMQQQNLIPRQARNEFPRFQQSTEEFRDRDPSRIGGEDPSRHPGAW